MIKTVKPRRFNMKKPRKTRTSLVPPTLGIKPDPQTTGYTCGFHAMRALYRHLRIPAGGLRARLGTDYRPWPPFPGRDALEATLDRAGWFKATTGTLPMDILAVLHEDGLVTAETAELGEFRRGLSATLADNLPGIALVDGVSHWLLVDGLGRGKYHIVDSCVATPYALPEDGFRARFTAGILLTNMTGPRDMGPLDYADCYRRGLALCLKCAGPITKDLWSSFGL